MDLPRRLDELDLPRFRQRACHQGWETRTRHFVVFATTSQEDATWTARQLGLAWHDIGRLADQWTEVHRQEAFAVGAVSVTLAHGPRQSRMEPDAGGPESRDWGDVYVDLAQGPAPLDRRLPELRRKAFHAFLHVAGHHDALPDWVSEGLAAYVSGEEPRTDDLARLDPPGTAANGWSASAPGWSAQETTLASPDDRMRAALWVRFLLEANDAMYAPGFFDAMSAAVSARRPIAAASRMWEGDSPIFAARKSGQSPSYFSGVPRRAVREVTRFVGRVRPTDRSPFDPLLAAALTESALSEWVADRGAGQPIVKPFSEDVPLNERHREMALVLKLLERFEPAAVEPVRSKVYEFRPGGAASVSYRPPTQHAMTTMALYHQLSRAPRWATIDTDGSLLVSNDRARLADVFGISGNGAQYRTSRREGQTVLEATFPKTGEVFQAWLEENPDNPARPIARIRRRPGGAQQ